ncbi:hypothetical protein ACF2G4_20265 (plasmid) [Pantoea sp. C3]|uniref:hypothetical protein n=1 Tax=Pantoea phytostimulans TaxID=2769024 RepID=UPI0038F65DF9
MYDIDKLMDSTNVELRMSLRKHLLQIVDKITFQSIGENNLIEILYKNDIYKHILISNKKLNEFKHEIVIQSNGNKIDYTTKSFSISENLDDGTCTFSDIYNAEIKDYALLANYLSTVKGKQWIVELMYQKENFNIVASN